MVAENVTPSDRDMADNTIGSLKNISKGEIRNLEEFRVLSENKRT